MKALNIRNVDPDDLTACHTIEANCFPPAEAAWTTSLRNRIEHFPEGFFVAEWEGRVVGQINSGSTNKDDITDEEFKQLIGHDPDGCHIVIFSLSVHPDFQRRGIADKLMSNFIEQAREMGKSTVKLLCKHDLIPYYARHGFLDEGLSASSHGGVPWHAMTLHL
ncbi:MULTISPECIES: GNAT family N-acetyltransferase [unclassified Pseudodesulfovibrio]|uniref:GNAT family N-acetyltransferase n=1 Tax=unclassified Pseudodesulfovibrio TaxID=2661612 RepID=UPI000FEB96ED|nr:MULTISPECIES: GNAT family N-acetyltransferase [unclassified Pseudodesulfovibrio]MCJ2163104.1 GNAT family N-acetyltransferase [Pseudodesulfovibrio sp. S3-i]RWU07096.1 GNAT family N-acetyltransferase [Pseudodesulfovibrio sp. S3]